MFSWKMVLYYHSFGTLTIDDVWRMAQQLGYEFFCWNDRIYTSRTARDTGFTIKDIK